MCDTEVYFESPASHMCNIVDYTYMHFICVQVNIFDILRKKRHVARKAWAIVRVFPNIDRDRIY